MTLFSNKLLSNLLVAGLVLTSPLHAQDSWKAFSAPQSGFSVDLPTQPEHIEQKIDIPKTDLSINYNTYISEPNEDVVYVISVWNYPAEIDMSQPEVNLQDGFGGMLSALPGSQVISMKMGELQGFKALEFLVKNDDIFFQGKLVLVHNTLYQVFTVYKTTADMSKDYGHFIDSFKLVHPEKQKVEPAAKAKSQKMNV